MDENSPSHVKCPQLIDTQLLLVEGLDGHFDNHHKKQLSWREFPNECPETDEHGGGCEVPIEQLDDVHLDFFERCDAIHHVGVVRVIGQHCEESACQRGLWDAHDCDQKGQCDCAEPLVAHEGHQIPEPHNAHDGHV